MTRQRCKKCDPSGASSVTTSKERKDNEIPVSMLGCENSARFNIRLYPPWLSLRWTEFWTANQVAVALIRSLGLQVIRMTRRRV